MSFIPNKNMHTLKIVCRYKPPTIGIVYKNKLTDKKKKLYYIELNGLEQLNDSKKVTELLFKFYPHILNAKNVEIQQIEDVVKLILKNQRFSPTDSLSPMINLNIGAQNQKVESGSVNLTEGLIDEIDLDEGTISKFTDKDQSLSYSQKFKNMMFSSGKQNQSDSDNNSYTGQKFQNEYINLGGNNNKSKLKEPSPFSYNFQQADEDEFQIEDLL